MARKKNESITQAEYARRRGVSPARISHLVRDGIIRLRDGKIDPAQADAAIENFTHPGYSKRGPGRPAKDTKADGVSYKEAATREKVWAAALKKLDYEERKGVLVNAQEYNRIHGQHILAAKARLRAIPSKVAGELYHAARAAENERDGQAAIFKKLLSAIDEALLDLSRWRPKTKTTEDEKDEEV